MRLWAAARGPAARLNCLPQLTREDRPLPSPRTSRYLHMVYWDLASTRDAAMTSHIDLPLGTDNRELEPRSAARDYADQSPRLTPVCGDFRSTSAQPLGRPNTYCTSSAPTITRATTSATPTISTGGSRRIAQAAAVRRSSPPRFARGSTSCSPQPGQAIATTSAGCTATTTRRGSFVRSAGPIPARPDGESARCRDCSDAAAPARVMDLDLATAPSNARHWIDVSGPGARLVAAHRLAVTAVVVWLQHAEARSWLSAGSAREPRNRAALTVAGG